MRVEGVPNVFAAGRGLRPPPDDRFLRTTLAAYDAIHEFHVEVHCLSCTSGVRRLPDSCGTQGQDRDRRGRD
jgi:hypothetical protein